MRKPVPLAGRSFAGRPIDAAAASSLRLVPLTWRQAITCDVFLSIDSATLYVYGSAMIQKVGEQLTVDETPVLPARAALAVADGYCVA